MKTIGFAFVIAMAVVIGFGISLGQVQAGTGYAQLTLQNNTPFTLDLYIDGEIYGCRALSGMMCTTHVTVGYHTFTAKASNGLSTSGDYYFEEGASVTWTVNYEPPQQ